MGLPTNPPVLIFKIMGIGFVFLCLNDFAAYFLIAQERTKLVLQVVAIAAIFNLLVNFLVVPIWGSVGAAFTAGATQLLVFICFCRRVKQIGIDPDMLLVAWKPIVASIGMAGVLWYFESWSIGFIFVLATVSYFLILNLLQVFDEYDFLVLRSLFNLKGALDNSDKPNLKPASQDISILIYSAKKKNNLQQCLDCLMPNLTNLKYEIIVVNNHQTESESDLTKKACPGIIFLQSVANQSFAYAMNRGVEHARGKYFLFLNVDILVSPGSIKNMVKIMENSPDIGLLGCRLLKDDGSIKLSFGRALSIASEFVQKFILNKLFENCDRPIVRSILGKIVSRENDVDWVSGECMLIRREALNEVGLLDENILMFMEDVDLGVRFKRTGWLVKYTPIASMTSQEENHSIQYQFDRLIEYRRSQLYFYKKHYGGWGLVKLKVYLYLKMAVKLSQSYFGRVFSKNKSEEIERLHRHHREVYSLIRDYQ